MAKSFWDYVGTSLLRTNFLDILDRMFTIPLSSILGSDDSVDLLLCPVRALRIYFKASEALRRSCKRLFIPSSTAANSEVSLPTGSFWMRSVILWAYNFAGLPPPVASNPHVTRTVASTMALQSNCPSSVTMQSCFWRSDWVLVSDYLQDQRAAVLCLTSYAYSNKYLELFHCLCLTLFVGVPRQVPGGRVYILICWYLGLCLWSLHARCSHLYKWCPNFLPAHLCLVHVMSQLFVEEPYGPYLVYSITAAVVNSFDEA